MLTVRSEIGPYRRPAHFFARTQRPIAQPWKRSSLVQVSAICRIER